MHHEDFTFQIPHGIGAMDGISHHYPFAFSLPVDFYEVGLHRVIVGDDGSDCADIPFVLQMVTSEVGRVQSSGCATFTQPMSPPGDQRIRNRRSSGLYAQGDVRLDEQSVTPGFRQGAGDMACGLESPGQSSTWRILLRFTGAGDAGSAKSTGVLAIARKPSPKPENVRRVTGDGSLRSVGDSRLGGSLLRPLEAVGKPRSGLAANHRAAADRAGPAAIGRRAGPLPRRA